MTNGVVSVLVVAGDGPPPGTTLDGDRAALALRAVGADDMVTTVVADTGGKQLVFARATGRRASSCRG